MSLPISRRACADMYGPTTGDRVRLGDTTCFEPGSNGWIDRQLDEAGKQQEVLKKLSV